MGPSDDTNSLSAESIVGVTFDSKFRGLDPGAVQVHLERVAAAFRVAERDRDAWHAEVERLQSEVAALQEQLVAKPDVPDEAALAEQLGQEAGRVLTEARSAAADRLAEAEAEAADIIAAAEELHAERSRAADAEAERIVSVARSEERTRLEAADDEAGTIRDKARADADSIRSEAGVGQQAADAEAARIIREAELTRRQILEDLARRRTAARRQIEQLRAGRERLLASHEVVRRALEEISEELNISMSEARAAAENAGHAVSESTIEEIEAEIETARLAGLLDTGPLPVVTPTAAAKPVDPAPVEAPADEPTPPLASDTDVVAEDAVTDSGDAAGERPSESTTPVEPMAAESPEPATAEASNDDGPLAEVVSLSAARQEVDTDRHPANRRPTAQRSNETDAAPAPVRSLTEVEPKSAEPEPEPEVETEEVAEVDEADEVETEEVAAVDEVIEESEAATEPEDVAQVEEADDVAESEDLESAIEQSDAAEEIVEPVAEESAPVEAVEPEPIVDEERVESLFARMRETQDAALAAGGGDDAAPEEPERSEVDVLVDDLARRLKRTLADEQSDVLSTLRGADHVVELEALVGDADAHRARYLAAVEAVLGDRIAESGLDDARGEIEHLVDALRRRVGDCLDDAGDTDAAVDRLRSIYREVKTRNIGEHARLIAERSGELSPS